MGQAARRRRGLDEVDHDDHDCAKDQVCLGRAKAVVHAFVEKHRAYAKAHKTCALCENAKAALVEKNKEAHCGVQDSKGGAGREARGRLWPFQAVDKQLHSLLRRLEHRLHRPRLKGS
jgi:hypothetical protein